jgi:DNA-binding transcriptional ArsR family regulator
LSENLLAEFVDVLKAAAETSRLRILALLAGGDLTVSDLTEILAQSQPRVSRHLKLLSEAGLIERYQEGSWAFFRLSDAERDFVASLIRRRREKPPASAGGRLLPPQRRELGRDSLAPCARCGGGSRASRHGG